jgi:ADP-ribose pyrophosphatase YjhB (NUDIX family)
MVWKRIRRWPGAQFLVRRALHGWFLASRGLTLGVRAAVIDQENRVLLVRHTYVSGWHLPGGGVEAGEDALAALRRELREEGAVEIDGAPQLLGIVHNKSISRRDHVLLYVVREFRSLGPKLADREIAEAAFWPLDALPGGTHRATRDRLAEIAAGRPPAAAS